MDTERVTRLLAEGRITQAQVTKGVTLGLLPASLAPGVNVPASQANLATIRQQAVAAFTANRAYIALPTPNAAQTTAQVKALSRQVNAVMRVLFSQLDGTD